MNTAISIGFNEFMQKENDKIKRKLELVIDNDTDFSQKRDCLMMITRCCKDENGKWAYEVLELWKDGICRSYLTRSSWFRNTGISRKVHTPFACFNGVEYVPMRAEKFAESFILWLGSCIISDKEKKKELAYTFMQLIAGDVVSLDLLGKEEYSRPKGM